MMIKQEKRKVLKTKSIWSGKGDSNSRPSRWQRDALRPKCTNNRISLSRYISILYKQNQSLRKLQQERNNISVAISSLISNTYKVPLCEHFVNTFFKNVNTSARKVRLCLNRI